MNYSSFDNLPSSDHPAFNPKEMKELPEITLSSNHGEIADCLLSRGQLSLLKGNLLHGLEFFDSANKLDPNNPKLYYSQGLSLFEYGNEEGREKALLLAGKKFKTAAAINPQYMEVWQAWGSTLCALGLTFQEHHYFQEASEKLRRAISLIPPQSKENFSELYWDYAIVCSHLAKHSEEALDLHEAIEAFEKAHSFKEELPSDFWRGFGDACLKFAAQINDVRFYVKGIGCFKHAISSEPASCQGWFSLANALCQLYELTHDEDHFSQANECFSTATQLQSNDHHIWQNWAQFLINTTRRQPDSKRLRACIEKCHRAHAIDPDLPLVQAIWAEALALLGELTDRLDLVFDAQNKIAEIVDRISDQPELWYAYGMCMNVFGRYFNDYDYFYQAIEKFQSGLSINRTCHKHWHAIAICYTTLGQLEAEPEILERAFRFFQRAIDLNPCSYYIFDYAAALSKMGEITRIQQWYDDAVVQFERALSLQRNAVYLHPNWLFHYACTLDALGDFHEEDFYYLRAIEIFSHVLMVDPDFHEVHHRLALALSHLAELTSDTDTFCRAIHHYRLILKHDEENDTVILDWALTLINLGQHATHSAEADQFYRDAEHKLVTAAKLGNLQAYYHLSCLYSLLGNNEKAIRFLEKAQSYDVLPPLEELLQDEWLEGLRSTGDFREFLFELEQRTNSEES